MLMKCNLSICMWEFRTWTNYKKKYIFRKLVYSLYPYKFTVLVEVTIVELTYMNK